VAKLEYVQEKKEDRPESVERIEVRPWALGGNEHQLFLIGSGMNFQAAGNILLEIIYSVNGVQFFYTRNFVQHLEIANLPELEKRLERFTLGEVDGIGFGDMLPETSIILRREKSSYQDEHGQEKTHESYHLEICADVGAVIGHESPGMRTISIRLPYLDAEEGIAFMRELIHEIVHVQDGKHPNPADLPPGASEWTFVRQMNQRAYNLISEDYQEHYFSNPLLTEMFDDWLKRFPSGSHILDAGCGHGNPVISRLLESGHQITGTDLSPGMLERARQNFPGVEFVNQMVSEITWEAKFDGACSLSSLLYLDPIDLSHSLYRLYCALKPGVLLFLYSYDTHPDWRGLPYDVELDQWMWSWSYGMEEAAQALEEFGYFKVLKMQDVTTEEEKEKRIANWRKHKQEEHEKVVSTAAPGIIFPPLDLSKVPQNLPYSYAIIARRGTGDKPTE
jgi:SAM-dependent methyltransferase